MDRDQVHNHVRDAYAKAVTASSGCDCQGKGVAAQWAGYGISETQELPKDVVENSFGCGNPLAFADVKPGQTVLDLGSGAGLDLLIASKRVGPEGRVIGVDMTDEMIAAALANMLKAGATNVEVRKGLIEELPVEDNEVDWVISNCVINLSPDKPAVFEEIARVLKPGGVMQVSDLVAEDLPAWVRTDEGLYNTCIAGALSEAEYLQGLRDAGLAEVEVLERLVYDEGMVRGLIDSELQQDGGCGCGCGSRGVTGTDIAQATRELTGKVASLKFRAVKPA